MKKTLLVTAISALSAAYAAPFTGNDAQSQAMGNTGVASADPTSAINYNPALLADYDEEIDFGLTLPAVKFYVADPLGFFETADQFSDEGGTLDQLEAIDSDALETAINNIPAVLTNIDSDITNITSAIDAIEAATIQGQLDTAITSLNTASNGLTTNSASLDANVNTVNVQMTALSNTSTSAQTDLNDLSGRDVSLGAGLDLISLALPSNNLGMAMSISTTSTIGATLNVSDEDLEPIVTLSADLSEYSAQATNLTAAVNTLAAANQNLTEHFTDAPDFSDPEYAAWETELGVREQAVSDASDDVDTEQTALDGFTGTNGNAGVTDGAVLNGEVLFDSDRDFTSEIEIVGANFSEVAFALARSFNINGHDVSLGVTPKLQSITLFEKTISMENSSDESDAFSSDPVAYFNENQTTLFRANVDLGAAKTWDFHGKLRAGVTLKDIIPWNLETDNGTELKIRPKLRVGGAHETTFTTLSADLDITENQPLKYGVATRYLGLGAELRAWEHAAIRLGYRNNLSVSGSHVVSAGLGLTPFGTGLDFSVWGQPGSLDEASTIVQDFGGSVQFSVNF